MSGNRMLCDTNVLIHLLGKNDEIVKFLSGKEVSFSVITELELYAKPNITPKEESTLDMLVEYCYVIELTQPIKQIVKKLRKEHRLKLPDAIIAATAIYLDIPFVTYDSDFEGIDDLKLILLKL